ncbi:formyl-CoA transferase [Antricoccus suffuscus]|uniref:Formyl-CoA transferase n=1 Tax=Antricoccus suffuscus TaxID=1629062 RepID=A0A2T1A1P2_9ACTN|nr:CoA transferase [Antricoccus suffuscus]PRZ42531.1 formyl-CoA transferase [Antricoccus suffuscus]
MVIESLPNKMLDGLVVIDLTRYIAGPYCTMLMADAGATVVKVEPSNGEDTRHLEPFLDTPGGEQISAYFLRMNRAKRSVALDLKHPRGLVVLERLIASADVLIENFRPGVMERLGLGAARVSELNPRVVYCSISGFGHSASPNRDRPAYNVVAEYEAGISVPKGPESIPGAVGPPVGDMFPSLHALSGILMALYRRNTTGHGERVDVAMYDSMLSLNELKISYAELYGKQWDPAAHPFYCPYGVFPVSDGFVCIDVTTDRQWKGYCEAIGQPDLYLLDGLSTGPERVARYEEVIREPLEKWFAGVSRDEAVEAMIARGVPAAVIRHPGEVLGSAQTAARGMRIRVDSGDGASVDTAGNPIKIGTSLDLTQVSAPRVGADTRWVAREIARLDDEQVDDLIKEGILTSSEGTK